LIFWMGLDAALWRLPQKLESPKATGGTGTEPALPRGWQGTKPGVLQTHWRGRRFARSEAKARGMGRRKERVASTKRAGTGMV